MIDNFIHVNENCMTLEQCQEIINFYEDNPKLHRKGEVLKEEGFTTVSYTHLTLPTILLV